MRSFTTYLFLILTFISSWVANAHEGHDELEKLKPRKAVKVSTDTDNHFTIQTATSTLIDGNLTVRLIAVPQLANKDFISELKNHLLSEGPILIEGILRIPEQNKPSRKITPLIELKQRYQNAATTLNLKLTTPLPLPQKRQIIVADLSLEKYIPLSLKLRQSVLKDTPHTKFSKKEFLKQFHTTPYFVGKSELGHLRDDILIAEMHKYLIKGKKNITMIVSAARMPNLELRLQKQHFKIKTTTWQTAWASP